MVLLRVERELKLELFDSMWSVPRNASERALELSSLATGANASHWQFQTAHHLPLYTQHNQNSRRSLVGMAESNSSSSPATPPSRTNRPMSEALLNEKVCNSWWTFARIASVVKSLNGADTMCLVGSLPQHAPHKKHSRRVVRYHLFSPPIQAKSMASMDWIGLWSGTSLGRV
jgi:hypothetical protein